MGIKTLANDGSVNDYLASIPDGQREDCQKICDLMTEITGQSPTMWGASMVGFGSYHYKSKGNYEADWFIVGFSARRQAITLYGLINYGNNQDLLKGLGKYKHGKGCLYIKSLNDVNLDVLSQLIHHGYANPPLGSG